MAEFRVIVEVFVPQRDPEDALRDEIFDGVFDQIRIAIISEAL